MRIGLHGTMPADEYHAAPAISNSMLSALDVSPRNLWAWYFAENRPARIVTEAMKAGTLLHMLALEPKRVPESYAIRPDGLDMRTKDGKAWKASVSPDLEIITQEQLSVAELQLEALLSVPAIAHALRKGHNEQSAFWRDEKTGLLCKARPDIVYTLEDGRDVLVDLKTAVDASPQGFAKAVATRGYHRQAAHYSTGWQEATGRTVARFEFAVVSNAYPFVAKPYTLGPLTTAQGYDEVRALLDLYAECKRTGQWPAYGNDCEEIEMPHWAMPSGEVEVSYVD